jgi:hypothetical protein
LFRVGRAPDSCRLGGALGGLRAGARGGCRFGHRDERARLLAVDASGPAHDAAAANRRLAEVLGADTRSADAARILRVPGTRNFSTIRRVP